MMATYNQTSGSVSVKWDAHGCPPFRIGADMSFLNRYKNSGVDFISLNIGFDLTTQAESIDLIHYFHRWISNHADEFELILTTDQLLKAKENSRLGIAFDIEGCNLLNNNIDMLTKYYTLGVRQFVFAYNKNNIAGGGCLDNNAGLTAFGKQLVKACNSIGMIIDCSHVSYKTSMDIMQDSEQPVVFSHSNPAALVSHPRNISDEQIKACAQNGGVIGINGIGIFLGNNDIRTEKIVEHIDYVAQLVGSKHVGIGMDCVFDADEIKDYVKDNPDTFPVDHGFNDVKVARPEQFAEIAGLLLNRGYTESDIKDILGNNFYRVAKKAWK